MSDKLIKKLGQDGTLYSAVDIGDGTWSADQLIARADAQAAQFSSKYQTTTPGEKVPTPGDKLKPTKPTVVNYGGK